MQVGHVKKTEELPLAGLCLLFMAYELFKLVRRKNHDNILLNACNLLTAI